MAVIYQITNMSNGKYYVGSADSFERRTWQHKYALRNNKHKNPKLQAAWNKYGEDMFVFEVLEVVPEGVSQLALENTYLHKCVGLPECYNINKDAELSRLGQTLSKDSKDKISKSRAGKAAGPDHYRYGAKLSEDVRAKISATQKGRPNPRKGQKMSELGRANVAAAVKRGEESHFYGKRPANADELQKAILARKPDGSEEAFKSLSFMRDTLGLSIATVIRACKSGSPIKYGTYAGWCLSYADSPNPLIQIPEEYANLPRSRSQAKAEGAPQYFTGVVCSRGHLSPRSTKGTCIACRQEDDKVVAARRRIAKQSDMA